MLNFSRLIDPKFIFNTGLGAMSAGFVKIFYIVFGLCLVLALLAYLITKQQEKSKNLPLAKLWQKLTNYFLTLGIVGFLLIFFRQQRIYILSMPLFWYLLFISALVWLIFIMRWIKVRMKKIQQEIKTKKEREKYLP